MLKSTSHNHTAWFLCCSGSLGHLTAPRDTQSPTQRAVLLLLLQCHFGRSFLCKWLSQHLRLLFCCELTPSTNCTISSNKLPLSQLKSIRNVVGARGSTQQVPASISSPLLNSEQPCIFPILHSHKTNTRAQPTLLPSCSAFCFGEQRQNMKTSASLTAKGAASDTNRTRELFTGKVKRAKVSRGKKKTPKTAKKSSCYVGDSVAP